MKTYLKKSLRLYRKKILINLFQYLFFIFLYNTNAVNAASDAPPFSLKNTDFVVAIAFFIFIGVLIYFKVPKIIINLLDKRANTIRGEIEEASRLLEDAKSILAKSEREHKNNILKAEELIKSAETTSRKLLDDSKLEIKNAVARKLDMAKKQIETNEKNVLNSIRDEIIDAAFKIAEESIEKKLDIKTSEKITKQSINEISTKLL